MKYLLVFDLDDTLLNGEEKITERTTEYIKNLDDRFIVVLASGRPFSGMEKYYNQLELKTPLITNNGSLIFSPHDKSFKTHEQSIDINTFKELFKKIKPYIKHGLFNNNYDSYVYNRTKKIERFLHARNEDDIHEGNLDEICDISPRGALFVVNIDYEDEYVKIVNSYSNLSTRCWGKDQKNSIHELYISNINKALGIRYVMDYYNIKNDHLICFGDGINDFEMLDMAYIGVAMKNGSDELKRKAKYITDYTNNEDGVIKFLEKIIKKL